MATILYIRFKRPVIITLRVYLPLICSDGFLQLRFFLLIIAILHMANLSNGC